MSNVYSNILTKTKNEQKSVDVQVNAKSVFNNSQQ